MACHSGLSLGEQLSWHRKCHNLYALCLLRVTDTAGDIAKASWRLALGCWRSRTKPKMPQNIYHISCIFTYTFSHLLSLSLRHYLSLSKPLAPSLSPTVVIYTCSRRDSYNSCGCCSPWSWSVYLAKALRVSWPQLALSLSLSPPSLSLSISLTLFAARRTRCVCVIFDALKSFCQAPVVFTFAWFRPGPNKKIFKIYRFILVLRMPLCVKVFLSGLSCLWSRRCCCCQKVCSKQFTLKLMI